MELLIVSATSFEITHLATFLEKEFTLFEPFRYQRGELTVTLLVTGVGVVACTYSLTKLFSTRKFDLVIQAGIAGAYNKELKLGEVVEVTSDCFADLGSEQADGSFEWIFNMQLADPDAYPFTQGQILNHHSEAFQFLPKVKGLTVNTTTGSASSILSISRQFGADVESMEGAAFAYVCDMERHAYIQLRSISNHVTPRNKAGWDIPRAVAALNEVLVGILKSGI